MPTYYIMAEKSVIFISCGIFKNELEFLVRKKGLEWNIIFLDAALHVNFDQLKKQLVNVLEEHSKTGKELNVLYGHCHPEIMEIMERYGAKKMNAGNCLEAIVGAEEIQRLDSEAKSFFLTVGWVNNWKKMFDLGKSEFKFDFKSMFANYERIIVFDTHILPLDEDSIREFSEFTNLPIERKTITLDHLLNLISTM